MIKVFLLAIIALMFTALIILIIQIMIAKVKGISKNKQAPKTSKPTRRPPPQPKNVKEPKKSEEKIYI